ncbi:neurensin-1 [Callorhinchus milii]|uniref:Neurensin 2 n=1 Tax=Callorhinchus milii TaxID=7868 RepID=V9L9W8_CALMI|nr:neurensin-1 [Callorhinchus milii]|eukprot:gi/632980141/ref/XP_007906866.1/ PREDICTED: neurensin-2 [Callorhinchus milii]
MAGCVAFCAPQDRAESADERRYGIRSYLHLFYEDCAGSVTRGRGELSIQLPASRRRSLTWKVGLWTGGFLLLTGLVTVTAGYLVPPRIEGIGEEEFVVVDEKAVEYNEALEVARLTGAALLSLGAAVMAGCVLALTAAARTLPKEFPAEAKHGAVIKTGSGGSSWLPGSWNRVQSIQPKAAT